MRQSKGKGAPMRLAAVALGIAASIATLGWSQTPQAPAIPQFPPGPDFAGVAGTAAERVRIEGLCGPNRNARDGYAPAPAFAGQTRAPIVRGTQGYAVEEVARIDRPWGMAFLPDGRMLVSFRNGGLRVVGQDGTVSALLEGAPEIVGARLGSGMYGVILDRDFARNRTVYMAYHTRAPGGGSAAGRIARARLSEDATRLTDLQVLREGADIQPRALVQAPDGALMILSASLSDASPDAQNLASQLGKVLRIRPDGSIPKDNPFLGRTDANPAVWALGFRDIHSAIIHPRTGELWAAENVPMGGDELNIMRRGRNYGFATISYGRQNSGAWINCGKTAQAGMEQPLYYWNPSIAPAAMMLYTGRAFPGWKDNLFLGGMSGMQVTRLVMRGQRVVAEEKLLMDRCLRIKVLEQGPDGAIYILTDQAPPTQNFILRLVPAATAPPPRTLAASAASDPPEVVALGAAGFARTCAACHGPRGAGAGAGAVAPKIAGITDTALIADIVRTGGKTMPPLGGVLSAQEIDAIARHVARLPQP